MNIVRTIDKEAENFVVVNNRDNNAQSGEDFTFPRIAIVGLKIDEQQQQQTRAKNRATFRSRLSRNIFGSFARTNERSNTASDQVQTKRFEVKVRLLTIP